MVNKNFPPPGRKQNGDISDKQKLSDFVTIRPTLMLQKCYLDLQKCYRRVFWLREMQPEGNKPLTHHPRLAQLF